MTKDNLHATFALCAPADIWAARRRGLRPVACPAIAGLPPAHAAALALLPITDANETLRAFLREVAAREGAVPLPDAVAIFAADPFLHLGELTELLHDAGIEAVVNFPTVQLFDGPFGQTLERVDLGLDAEIKALGALAASGFRVHALAVNKAVSARLTGAGLVSQLRFSEGTPLSGAATAVVFDAGHSDDQGS